LRVDPAHIEVMARLQDVPIAAIMESIKAKEKC
jgi:hypothetical protein